MIALVLIRLSYLTPFLLRFFPSKHLMLNYHFALFYNPLPPLQLLGQQAPPT